MSICLRTVNLDCEDLRVVLDPSGHPLCLFLD
jgi:hypothetical protein